MLDVKQSQFLTFLAQLFIDPHPSSIGESMWGRMCDDTMASIRKRFLNVECMVSGEGEYPANSGGFFLEPCLKVEEPDHLVNLQLAYDSHAIDGEELAVTLKAANYPFNVLLHYRVYPNFDLIDRWVEVENRGTETVVLENIQSAVWYVPHTQNYRLTHMAGRFHLSSSGLHGRRRVEYGRPGRQGAVSIFRFRRYDGLGVDGPAAPEDEP
ncbi:MAG: glycoside hydrolase family 36 N-terminal domain-containing protein [Thermoguttaceae bacterium]